VSFPLGTDPNQQWRSGYYPILWTNQNYKMLYANFGHNAMDYAKNVPLSVTFANETQNRFVIDGLLWLGGGTTTPPPTDPISATAWYGIVNRGNGKCVDARAAASSNGTVIKQYTCNGTLAQQYQFQPTSGSYARINNRINSAQVIDVTGVSTADNAPLQLWSYGDGANQQWQAVAEGAGSYHFVSRNIAKCLSVPGRRPPTASNWSKPCVTAAQRSAVLRARATAVTAGVQVWCPGSQAREAGHRFVRVVKPDVRTSSVPGGAAWNAYRCKGVDPRRASCPAAPSTGNTRGVHQDVQPGPRDREGRRAPLGARPGSRCRHVEHRPGSPRQHDHRDGGAVHRPRSRRILPISVVVLDLPAHPSGDGAAVWKIR
jgi:hypothetical protein